MLTIGDLRGSGSSRQGKNLPTFAFQHSLVRGYLPDELVGGPEEQGSSRGIQRWQAHGAWGGAMAFTAPAVTVDHAHRPVSPPNHAHAARGSACSPRGRGV